MEIKHTTQGMLIYIAIAIYALAFISAMIHLKKLSNLFYFLGFAISATAVGYRWNHVHHVPMQNLFEVFLFLGAIIYPISIFCRRFLNVANLSTDMLLAIVILIPAGFVFDAEPRQLPPALQSWIFAPHVAVYMLSYILMVKAAFQAFAQLIDKAPKKPVDHELSTYRMICAGFPLLTLGMLLGSYWGKMAWGDYWGWDPKELWSLASWLVYIGYFHYRYMFGKKHPNINSLWAIGGMIVIIITLLWVNLSTLFPGMHSYAT